MQIESLVSMDDGSSNESLERVTDVKKLGRLYRNGSSLSVDLGYCNLGKRTSEAVEAAIESSIRGKFSPSEVGFTIGYHDVFDTFESDRGRFIARPFISVRIWGYTIPVETEQFQELVFAVADIRRVKQEIAEFSGTLEEVFLCTG
jgi:hypothetical protein